MGDRAVLGLFAPGRSGNFGPRKLAGRRFPGGIAAERFAVFGGRWLSPLWADALAGG